MPESGPWLRRKLELGMDSWRRVRETLVKNTKVEKVTFGVRKIA